MRKSKLKISIILAFLPLALGAMFFCGTILSRTLNPYDDFSPTAIFLSVIVLVLAAVSFTLILTLVAQAITKIGNFDTGFWPSRAALLQEVSAWLIIYWIILWGLPFTFGMSLYAYSSQYFNHYLAGVVGLFAGIFGVILLRKLLSHEIWRTSAKFDPARSLGWKKGLILTIALIIVGSSYLHSCYIFEVNLPSTEFNITDQIEVRARMSGRINNHNSLRVRMVAINSVGLKSEPLAFLDESNGHYVTWIDLNKAAPGKYRIIIFFNNYRTEPVYKRLGLWMGHNNLIKTFIVRIKQHGKSA
ncbi:MAG: hypothetical protein JRE23_12525 [Deltaproteobacteria bacterium]|nr:hypothetical protein [Deltaproteobacteria bacterium]